MTEQQKERVRLVSFLGTGPYKCARYSVPKPRPHPQAPKEDQETSTRFFSLALANARWNRTTEELQHIVLATDEAWNGNKTMLSEESKRIFGSDSEPALERRPIPHGTSKEDLWQIFEVTYQAIFEADGARPARVVLDITHGFRAQPFFAAAVVAYGLALADQPPSVEVWYGPFNQGLADRGTTFHAWDLSPFVELLQWTQAFQVFFATGGLSRHLHRLVLASSEEQYRYLKDKGMLPKKVKKNDVQEFFGILRELIESLTTVRIGDLITGVMDESKKRARPVTARFVETTDRLLDLMAPHWPVVVRPLQEMRKMIAPLAGSQSLTSKDGQAALRYLAQLYGQWRRIPETLIVMREGLISELAGTEKSIADPVGGKGGFDHGLRRAFEQQITFEAEGPAKALRDARNDVLHGGFQQSPWTGKVILQNVTGVPKPKGGSSLLQLFTDGTLARELSSQLQGKRQRATRLPHIYLVSRHPGAIAWLRKQGRAYANAEVVDHLNEELLQRLGPGDQVIGTLPLHLAAQVCERGATYVHLAVDVPPEKRGSELTMAELERYGVRLEPYHVTRPSQTVEDEA